MNTNRAYPLMLLTCEASSPCSTCSGALLSQHCWMGFQKAWLVGGPPNVASGSYCWNRAARSIDLPLSGTASTEADVDELVGFLRETCD